MTARLRKLLDQRATAWSKVQDIQDRRSKDGYEPSDEDGETYTRALDDVERLSREIEEEERADRMRGVMDGVDPAEDRSTNPTGEQGGSDNAAQYRDAFDTYLRRGISRVSPDQQQLLEAGFVVDERAQAAGVDTAGGYTVPEGFRNTLVEAMKAFGGLLGVAEVLTTSTGNTLPWPTNDDTSNEGELLDENTAATEGDMVFGQAKLGAYTFSSKLVRVSLQLLQDSAFNLNAWLPTKLGERIGRASAGYFATGTGTDQPKGITVGLSRTVTSSTVGKIAYDDLVDLEHTVDPAYRNGGRCRYVLNDTAIRDIRKLKDSQQRPLWVPAMAGGVPSTINGQPYTVDNKIPAVGLGAKPIVYGDIKAAFVIRQVLAVQTLRLAERYAEFLQVGFLGFARLDSTVQDDNAAATLTIKAA